MVRRRTDPLIERAEPHQAPLLAALHLETALVAYADIFPPEAPPPRADENEAAWAAALADPARSALAATVDGVLVGVVMAGPDEAGNGGLLSRLYVAPSHWHAGIGSALHDAALSHLAERGYREAALWVLEHNSRARRFYERRGWTQTADRKPVYAPAGIDDVGYRKSLTSPS